MNMTEHEEEAGARAILASRFDENDVQLVRQEGGLSNCVFEAATSGGSLVLRMGPIENRSQAFKRECRAIKHAGAAGVPVPEVVGQGELGPWAYICARKIEGESAANHPKRLEIVRRLARLASGRIHSIPTAGFGHDFTFGHQATNDDGWRQWIEEEFKAADRLTLLNRHGIIDDEQHAGFTGTIATIASWRGSPVLNHGDLRLKNVLVDQDARIVALIDWESCLSAIGPHWDLSIALHDLSVDQKEAFLDGYGLTAEEVRTFAPAWRLFNALNYAPELERILQSGDDTALDHLRMRFSGLLDLYGEPECPR